MMDLPAYIAARLETPFAWGSNDCVSFAIGWVEIATGHSLLPTKMWQSELQAARIIKQQGGLFAVLEKNFTRLKHPNYAQNGDLVLVDGDRPTVYLVSGARIVAPGESGLVFRPRREAQHAWTY